MFAIFFVFTSFCSYAYRLVKSRKEIKFWLLVSLFVCSFLPKSVFREFFPLPKSVFRGGYFPLPTKSVIWEVFSPAQISLLTGFFTCPNQSSVEPLFSDHPKNQAKVALKRGGLSLSAFSWHLLLCVCVCVCMCVCACVCVCMHACACVCVSPN